MSARTIPDDVLELAKPAIEKRIGELVEAAFKLAQYAECSETLEKTIDTCSSQYFGDGARLPTHLTERDDFAGQQIPPMRVGKNIVQGGIRTSAVPAITKMKYGKKSGKPSSYSPQGLVPASRYTNLGRPASKYVGLTYSGSVKKPWLVRYQGVKIGTFVEEDDAAKAYDATLQACGKDPVNFSN